MRKVTEFLIFASQKIGAGLDKLSWKDVENTVWKVFSARVGFGHNSLQVKVRMEERSRRKRISVENRNGSVRVL